jgi:UDP-4-amino-4,6-dideoxy-N-acetyl-beta-L-altrosamine N-acetyltransferase
MVDGDVERVRAWRNDDSVRRHMLSKHEIGSEESRRWFANLGQDPNRHLMILETDDGPAGFVSIGPVRAGGIADWGFYAAPGAPRGTGRLLGELALAFAFDQLGLHKLCGEVIDGNEASQRFHRRLGFKQEGELVEQHYDGQRYRNLIRFGLLARDWRERKEERQDG